MADLAITAADVIRGSNAQTENGQFGEVVDAGEIVYRDSADGEYKLADCDSATAAVRSPRGMALNSGADGQPGTIQREGDVTLNAVLTAGTAYYLSDTPGKIAPVGDLLTGDYPVLVGIAKSTTVLALKFNESGVAL